MKAIRIASLVLNLGATVGLTARVASYEPVLAVGVCGMGLAGSLAIIQLLLGDGK